MKAGAITALTAILLGSGLSPASAQWYAKPDSAGAIVVTAVMKTADNVALLSYITCAGNGLKWTFETNSVATDAGSIKPSAVSISIPRADPAFKLDLSASAVSMPGGALALESKLSSDQSRQLLRQLQAGRKIDATIAGNSFESDDIHLTISGQFASSVALALPQACKLN